MANPGRLDRIVRRIQGIWRSAPVARGVAMSGTAAFRLCPADSLAGVRTCPVARR